jgi:hypothetical protein
MTRSPTPHAFTPYSPTMQPTPHTHWRAYDETEPSTARASIRTALLAIGSLFVVPGALALVAPHVLEGIVAVARHGSEPWLAWSALALLAGLPLTLAGLPWTPRAHAEIDATVAALAGTTLLAGAPRPHAAITAARADWPAPESVPRRAA